MDQKKIGSFMKELRKGKELTQEQIADQFAVSNRTISRWENGYNMPDLDILIDMADFYEIDIRELLNGERKSEKMNEEVKETVLMVADYSNDEKGRLLKRMHYLFILGMVGFIVALVIEALGLEKVSPYEEIASFGLGVAFGMVIIGVIFTSRYSAQIRNLKLRLLGKLKK